jgi:hypothetical protein
MKQYVEADDESEVQRHFHHLDKRIWGLRHELQGSSIIMLGNLCWTYVNFSY